MKLIRFLGKHLIFTIYNTSGIVFLIKKMKNKVMIINITKDLNNNFKIVFTQRVLANNGSFKGLMFFTFKTSNPELFNNFKKYGRWLNEKNKYSVLLLRLFKQEKQNIASYNIS